MLREVLRNRLFLCVLLFFVLIVVGGVFYLKSVEHETAERTKPLTETQKPPTEAPVGDTSQDRHSHADGTWHAGPGESEVPEILPTESESELVHPGSSKAAEAKPDEVPTKQAPYHPHDELSPEEHQRVHAELKQYGSKLDDLIRLYEENLADLQAGRITPEESRNFLESANPKRDSIIANIKRLQGE